jgi:hypothetical protein
MSQTLQQIINEVSLLNERSEKAQIDIFKDNHSMIAWIAAISTAGFVFGFSTFLKSQAEIPARLIVVVYTVQIIAAVMHRLYSQWHINLLNEKILYINLQKLISDAHPQVSEKEFGNLDLVSISLKVKQLNLLQKLNVTNLDKLFSRLKTTKVWFTFFALVVVLCFLTNQYLLFYYVL